MRPNNKRAKQAVLLIWIVLFLEIISLYSGYLQHSLLQTIGNGGEISTETATANDTREQIIGILYMIGFIISAVTFIRWFRRAYYNLHQNINYLGHSENWAAISWFIPFVNLYRPFQIMREIYLESKELLIKKGIGINQKFNSLILGFWWTLWIINNLIGQYVFRATMNAESINDYISSTMASMVGNIIGIPLALITIKIIKDYSIVESQLFDHVEKEKIHVNSV